MNMSSLKRNGSILIFTLVAWVISCEESSLCRGPEDCAEGFFCDSEGYCTQLTAYVRCGDDRCFSPEVCVDGLRCEEVLRGGAESGGAERGGTDIPLANVDANVGGEPLDRGQMQGGSEASDIASVDMSPPVDMMSSVDMRPLFDMGDTPTMRDQGGQMCQTTCDCPNGLSCAAGTCSAEEAVYCCGSTFCPPGEACQTASGALDLCPESSCETACDCRSGLSCVGGRCVLENEAVFCCDQGSCPSGGQCEDSRGVRGMCPAEPCVSACDCSPGQRCVEGACLLQGDPIFCCEEGLPCR